MMQGFGLKMREKQLHDTLRKCRELVFMHTVGPTNITLHEFIVPGLIIELHYICSVCLN